MNSRSFLSRGNRQRRSRKIGFRGPGTSGESQTATEHWQTGAPWTRFSRPFPPFLLFLSSPPTRLRASCRLLQVPRFSSSLSVVECLAVCPVAEDRLLIATKYSGDCPTYGNGFSSDNRDRTGRETTTRATATDTRKRRRGRETVPWFCARLGFRFNFLQLSLCFREKDLTRWELIVRVVGYPFEWILIHELRR